MIGRRLSLAVSGQSLASMFRLRGREAFAARFAEIAPKAPKVRIWGYTRGGSVAPSTNCSPGPTKSVQYFWWDMEADAPSDAFAAGLASVQKFADQPCECLFWDQGQFDAPSARDSWGNNPARAIADYKYATRRVLETWRARLCPDDPASVPILLMPHAPHKHEQKPSGRGVLRVREAQYELMTELPNVHDAGLITGMEMKDNLHPSELGVEHYAASVANAFATRIMPLLPPEKRRRGAKPRVEQARDVGGPRGAVQAVARNSLSGAGE